jgi:hypothetical protein
MLDAIVALIQLAAAVLLVSGAFLCLFCDNGGDHLHEAEPRNDVDGSKVAKAINLSDAWRNRRTDFAIGFRTPTLP